SMLVRVQVGVVGEKLERELNRRGFTLGHFPASMYGATVGGFVACRSAGQASTRYGKIEDILTCLQAVLPDGVVINTKTVPRKATGPDINSLLLGSEGALAIVTEVSLKIRHLPESRLFLSYTFDSVSAGLYAIREFMQEGIKPAIVRLYDETDTALSMTALGYEDVSGCLLIVVCEGRERFVGVEAEIVRRACKNAGGRDRGERPAEHWFEHRYAISYNQSPILSSEHMILDTIEVACLWKDVVSLYEAMRKAIEPYGTVMAHFSHAYPEGISIYFTIIANADDEIAAYDGIWKAAMTACLRHGGVISHHHGIGRLKAPWLKAELGEGYKLLCALKKQLDPNNILNPGVLGLGE
ncbi:MAG TPA: FAD-binding oxidoreductase, partial [Proteobacteria bacterium]|nr:FAD-binding oxidoreductase [Pseudomonadota bacterium]